MTESSVETIVPPGYAYDAPSSPCLSLAVMHRSGPARVLDALPVALSHRPPPLLLVGDEIVQAYRLLEVVGGVLPTASCMPASSAILR